MTTETLPAVRTVALDSYTPVELQSRLVELQQEGEILQNFFKAVMVKDHDYGVIPGTGKPTLLKPGAEKLAEYYGYAPTVKAIDESVDRETGFYRARVTVALVSKRTGTTVAEGVGEANTKEGRYRWRDAQRLCPHCQQPAIIKGKAEYGGGWLCFGRKGGCGAKFDDDDKSIVGQPLGRVENDDPFTLWNTVLKMGKKRALIDAVLSATRSSGVFTQDLDELTGWVADGEVLSSAPASPTEAATPTVGGLTPEAMDGLRESARRATERPKAFNQLGEFEGPDGKINQRQFMVSCAEQGVKSVDLMKVAPSSDGNGVSVTGWLQRNTDKTALDLIEAAKAAKESEGAEQPASVGA